MGRTSVALVGALALAIVAGAASWASGSIGAAPLPMAVTVMTAPSTSTRDVAPGALELDRDVRASGEPAPAASASGAVAVEPDQPATPVPSAPDGAPDVVSVPASAPPTAPTSEESAAGAQPVEADDEPWELISVEETLPADVDLPPPVDEADGPDALVLDPAPDDLPGDEAHLRELRRSAIAAFDDCFWAPGDPCSVAAALPFAVDLSATMFFPGTVGAGVWPTLADDGSGDLLWDLGVVEVQLLSYHDGSWRTAHVHATARTDAEGKVTVTLSRP